MYLCNERIEDGCLDLHIPPNNSLEALRGNRPGKRAISADTALRLAAFFGTSICCSVMPSTASSVELKGGRS